MKMADTTVNDPSGNDEIKRVSGIVKILRGIALIRESGVGMVGAAICLFWALVAIFAPWVAPFDPLATLQPMAAPGTLYEAGPGGTFWLGTDHIGRDILSRIIWGSRTVLIYAPLATLSAYIVGIAMGLIAGYKGGWIDEVLSFLSNVILAFPVLVLYVIIIAIVGASAINIVIAITFASAPSIMRIVRGLVLDLRTRDYVAAAETRGESNFWVMVIEILPNARGPLIVDGCLRLGYVTITIGVLGFLGLGLPPPDPDWGGMINETRSMAMFAAWMSVFPCLAISSLVLGLNLLADGLREISMRD
jgi:peptide/nickel transport system permease protein